MSPAWTRRGNSDDTHELTGSWSSAGVDVDEPLEEAPESSRRQGLAGWARREGVLIAVLVGAFLARLLVSDRSSLWLDEIYSVTIHGAWNESATQLVQVLANGGVYPPVYFVGLFEWMEWFGTSEFAVRLPSNLFITFAGLFLYLALRVGLSRRIALTSVILFSLLYTSTYYGLEARPYALSIFLVTLSST
jgi:mannosyltransferase